MQNRGLGGEVMQLLENQILNENPDFTIKLNPDYLDVYVPQ
jgi:hypothetical protein